MSRDVVHRLGRPDDAAALAAVHAAAFPDYFQTHLGPDFLRRFYAAFLRPGHLVVVAEADGVPIGLVAGTDDLAKFRSDLYPPNLIAFTTTFLGKLVTDPVVRRSARSRLRHLGVAAQAVFERWRGRPDAADGDAEHTMYLFSICVDPAQQGAGIATPLLAEFNRRSAELGCRRVVLTVVDDNERAIRFYEREGWTRDAHEGGSFLYSTRL